MEDYFFESAGAGWCGGRMIEWERESVKGEEEERARERERKWER